MHRVFKPSVLILFLFLFSFSYSQDKTIDSLKIVLQNPKLHDTTRIRIITDVVNNNYNEYDKNYYKLNQMIGALAVKNYNKKLAPELHNKYAIAVAAYYAKVATEYSRKKGETKKMIGYYDKAISILKSAKIYDEMYATYLAKASVYFSLNQDDKAIPLTFAALKFFEKKTEYPEQVAGAFSMLSKAYSGQKDFKKALAYSLKAVHYYDLYYSQYHENNALYQKALEYNTIASLYDGSKNYDKSIEYCNKALEVSRKIGANTITAVVLARLGEVQLKLSNLDEAEKLYKESLAIDTSDNVDKLAMINSYTGLGEVYLKKGDLKNARSYADKAYFLSEELGELTLQKNAAYLVYYVSRASNDYKTALLVYGFIVDVEDSSKIEAAKNELAQQNLKYKFEKKELKLKLDAEKKTAVKNNWLIGLSALLLLLLLGGYFYYRNNKQKQAITIFEKDQIKQKLLITQMNPHFIFNSIDNIQGLIHDKKDKEAVSYLTKFSVLTRQILENSNENYISLTEEVQMTENYLAIQQLLYNNKFNYSISLEKEIDGDTIYLPPMLTQPFIENAIKHGLSSKDENGIVDIRFYLEESKLFFEVLDNGKGFSDVKKETNHKSLAMTITKERLIGYTKNQDFVVQTDNIKDTNENVVGAKVSFEIPYIYEN